MHASLRAFVAIHLLFVSLAASAADGSPENDDLDEVVVTADLRGREVRLLPTSVTVLDARLLTTAGVQHFEDVMALVPNLNWSAGTSRPRFFQIRGVGELSQWQGAPNPSVGFLIDDIDFSGVGMPAALADVDHIEVLRGPQGTIYGANALAGLIAINTRNPSRTPDFETDFTVGDYGTRGANAAFGGPLGAGEAAWRLSLGRYDSDGFRRNSFLGRNDTNGYSESGARLKVASQPGEHWRARVTALWSDLDNGYDAFSIDNSRVTLSDKPGQDAQLSRALALRLEYDGADAFDIQSRTAVSKVRSVYSFDADWGNDEAWGVYLYDWFQRFDRDHRTLSQDLRLVSRASVARGASFDWLTGVYALRTDEDAGQRDAWRDEYFGTGDALFSSVYRATNLAAYGEVEWRLASSTVLAAGLRAERRSADYHDSNGEAFSPDETMYGGSITLRRELDARRSVYLRFARGYKAGGFNIGDALPAELRTFDTETLHDLELGLRGASVDSAWTYDAALFYMRRQEQQVPIGVQLVPGDPSTFVLYTDNAASGENYGLEATLAWHPGGSLSMDLGAAWLETRYLDYAPGGFDLDGREQPHAPQYQFSLGLEYRHADFFARLDVSGQDDFYFDDSHDERAPSRMLTNFKAGLSGKRWLAEVWVQNLFDEYYSQRGFWFGNEPPDFPDTRYVQAGDPRRFGVRVTYQFR